MIKDLAMLLGVLVTTGWLSYAGGYAAGVEAASEQPKECVPASRPYQLKGVK